MYGACSAINPMQAKGAGHDLAPSLQAGTPACPGTAAPGQPIASLPSMLGYGQALVHCKCTTHPARRRAQWLAVLLGPAGCTARWLLSQYNYRVPGAWRWLPAGTLAANLLGCLTDFIVGVRATRPAHARLPPLRPAARRARMRRNACLPERLRPVRHAPLLAA